MYDDSYDKSYVEPKRKSRLVAGLLGIFFGAIGVHNFYLGNKTMGLAQIIVTIGTFGVGSLWGIIEGILILCGRVKTDSDGIPLK
ncbi:MAG: TM2 domain-containing protein [Lachnospiraceae bacterium]|nr:TM2 domain-containing protein [Lachnospiraceae bacterium]